MENYQTAIVVLSIISGVIAFFWWLIVYIEDRSPGYCRRHGVVMRYGGRDDKYYVCDECEREKIVWRRALIERNRANGPADDTEKPATYTDELITVEAELLYSLSQDPPKDGERSITTKLADHGWRLGTYCKFHESEGVACGCVRYYKVVVYRSFDIIFIATMSKKTLLPKTLGYRVEISAKKDEESVIRGDYRGIEDAEHFAKAYRKFLLDAYKIVAAHEEAASSLTDGEKTAIL